MVNLLKEFPALEFWNTNVLDPSLSMWFPDNFLQFLFFYATTETVKDPVHIG